MMAVPGEGSTDRHDQTEASMMAGATANDEWLARVEGIQPRRAQAPLES